MKKAARLDQILIRLGYVDEDQITRALARQQADGGRLGMNLVQLGAITERQLVFALAEQFDLPATVPAPRDVPEELVRKLPAHVVIESLILPLSWNEGRKILTLAVANPGEDEALGQAKEAMGAQLLRVKLAPEAILREIALSILGQAEEEKPISIGIVLPELFDVEEEEEEEKFATGTETPAKKVLMVAEGAPKKNFLPPVFLREGFELTVVAEEEEAAEALGGIPFDSVLLAQDMADTFSGWIRDGRVPKPDAEVTVFSSVSDALLENPLSYEMTVRSLRAAVQALADSRCAQLASAPPYGLIAADVEAMARSQRMRRVALDGLHLSLHFLLPAPVGADSDPVGSDTPFGSFTTSLEMASRIRFPWKLESVLDACHALYSGRASQEDGGKWNRETLLAAQILALAWYRHNHVVLPGGTPDEAMMALRSALREKAGTLAPLELVEAYLHIMADRGGPAPNAGDREVLLVGGDRMVQALKSGMTRLGCRVVATEELADAQTMAQRRPPGAIVIERESFPGEVERIARVVKLDGDSLLFVLTDSADPSLVLNLLDVGVDDVFAPPHDFDVVAARLNNAIRSRTVDRPEEKAGTGQFSATFDVFSFLDLVQTLGQGFKTVRIELTRTDGERATVFMEKGRMTHAVCGDVSGVEAVYRVITWEDEGEFTVHSETEFPEATIQASTESILMEGCRLLDESRR